MIRNEELPVYIKHFAELKTTELYGIPQAREQVFTMEQGVTCEDIDGLDTKCTHMWCESDGKVIAYLSMIPAGLCYRQPSIGRVLVLPDWRRKGLSRRLMDMAISYIATAWGGLGIMISAQG